MSVEWMGEKENLIIESVKQNITISEKRRERKRKNKLIKYLKT